MHAETQLDAPLFGLFEISDQGIIRYYQPPADGDATGARAELIGCNFFNEVVPTARTKELRERIHHFRRSGKPTESFDLALNADDDLTVRVLLTTIQERTAGETRQSVLVHIRRA
ncbi:MAG TPA: hypothetical protein VF527_02000 [Pyrinomonadaceae bacterium]|jgi:hypothetical protein